MPARGAVMATRDQLPTTARPHLGGRRIITLLSSCSRPVIFCIDVIFSIGGLPQTRRWWMSRMLACHRLSMDPEPLRPLESANCSSARSVRVSSPLSICRVRSSSIRTQTGRRHASVAPTNRKRGIPFLMSERSGGSAYGLFTQSRVRQVPGRCGRFRGEAGSDGIYVDAMSPLWTHSG